MRKNLFRNSKGDTIVEVLIAIAVVSSVLGIAYATMNRNILIGRDNQERTEASKLAQGQIEALKNEAEFDASELNAENGAPFCIDVANTDLSTNNVIPNSAFRADYSDVLANYPVECTKSGLYHLAVTYDTTSKIYHAYVRWESIRGGTRVESIIVYRY